MKQKILTIAAAIIYLSGSAQQDSVDEKKERLDFAKTYFEAGGTFLPGFTGKKWSGSGVSEFKNPASVIQYLNWGAFHFWGHAEIYVSIPLNYSAFRKNEEGSAELLHSVATGARYYPLVYHEGKIRPYVGASWSAMDFRQKIKPGEDQPVFAKDFIPALDAGVLYGYRSFAFRLGLYYFPDTKWNYPLSKTLKETIFTPGFAFQAGLQYSFESSRNMDKKTKDKWNSYPRWSKQSLGSVYFGDFFVGAGPSMSFSLKRSQYNKEMLPYLKDQMASSNYFDLAAGYHFQKTGLFTALSFRNPEFRAAGFGTSQTIRKTSLALEVNKFLLDYSGFAPYVGINAAYDHLRYTEASEMGEKTIRFKGQIEPGLTVGWDIQPGKNQESLILRTNLRWYPLSSLKIDGKSFDFKQLEYNLIQVVFYPQRHIRNKREHLH